jgi:hypothetical protein
MWVIVLKTFATRDSWIEAWVCICCAVLIENQSWDDNPFRLTKHQELAQSLLGCIAGLNAGLS